MRYHPGGLKTEGGLWRQRTLGHEMGRRGKQKEGDVESVCGYRGLDNWIRFCITCLVDFEKSLSWLIPTHPPNKRRPWSYDSFISPGTFLAFSSSPFPPLSRGSFPSTGEVQCARLWLVSRAPGEVPLLPLPPTSEWIERLEISDLFS